MCLICVILPLSNGAVQIRVGLELAGRKLGMDASFLLTIEVLLLTVRLFHLR